MVIIALKSSLVHLGISICESADYFPSRISHGALVLCMLSIFGMYPGHFEYYVMRHETLSPVTIHQRILICGSGGGGFRRQFTLVRLNLEILS